MTGKYVFGIVHLIFVEKNFNLDEHFVDLDFLFSNFAALRT